MGMIQKINNIWKNYGLLRTVAACFGIHTANLMVGLSQGYSAILLPQLEAPNSSIQINNDTGSWIASLAVASNPIGSFLAGFLSEVFGRKLTIQCSAVPFLIGWIIISFSNNIFWLYMGRGITGLAVGMTTIVYTYIAEITPAKQRGILAAFGPVITSFGVLLVYVLGYFLHWQTVAQFCIIVSITELIVIQLVPESPSWLVGKNRPKDALNALKWLRANLTIAERDLNQLIANHKAALPENICSCVHDTPCKRCNTISSIYATIEPSIVIKIDSSSEELTKDNNKDESSSIWSILTSVSTVKPFIILILFFLFQELSGIYIILFYSVDVFNDIGTHFNKFISTIIVGVLRFIASIIGAILIQKHGRKTLSTISGAGMGVFLLTCAIYLKYSTEQSLSADWLPLVCILGSVVFSMFGFLQLPYVMNSELFPLKVRGTMSGIVLTVANIFIFVSVKIYPTLLYAISFSGLMFLFGGASCLGAIYCYIVLPETKNKTLAEIEEYFKPKQPTKTTQNQSTNNG